MQRLITSEAMRGVKNNNLTKATEREIAMDFSLSLHSKQYEESCQPESG